MAVNSARKFGRISLIAAVLASVSLPGLALAEPGWRNRGGGGEARQERVGDNRGGGRQGGWQQQAPQQQQQQAPQQQRQAPQQRQGGWQPQAQAPAQPPAPRQQGGWQQQAPQQTQQQQGGWQGRRDGQQQQQSGWQGGQQRADRQDRRGDGGQGGQRRGGWNGDQAGQQQQQEQQQQQQTRQGSWGSNRQDGGSWTSSHRRDQRGPSTRTGHWNPRDHSRVTHRDGYYRSGYYRNGYYYGHSGDYYWDHRWRNNRRYDWHQYRRSHPSHFQVGIYYAPYRNYRYERLSVGWFMDSLFFGSRYWINDPWRYRLPDVYGPYRWVRYYDDAVLVDTYTGEVVDVIYDFFW